MTILFKTGAWTSRTTTGTDVITGVGFQPKVILAFATNIFQTTDNTFGSDYNFYFGCAVDTTAANQRSLHITDLNNQPGGNGSRCFFVNGSIGRSVGGVTAKAAISAIGSDGFTVNWTTNDGTAKRLSYICIGGTDITNTSTGTITAPTTTGNQSYTGPGFQPDFLMFWGSLCKTDDVEPTGGNSGASMGIGFATSSTKQVAVANASELTGGSGTVSKRYQRSDNVISFIELDGLTPTAGALGFSLVSMNSTGFTLNYTTNAIDGQSSKFGYLAIKGGSWIIGSASGGTSASQTVSGLGITPSGVILASACAVTGTAIGANMRISLGGGSGSSDSRCGWAGMRDGVGTSIASMVNKSAKAISICTEATTASSTTVNAEASVSALASGSFTLAWSTTGATSFEFLYVAVGGGAAAQNITVSPPAESITIASPVPAKTKGKIRGPPAESITIASPTPARVVKKIRGPSPEQITFGPETINTLILSGGHRRVQKSLPVEHITISDSVTRSLTQINRNVTRTLPPETIHISDNANIVGKTKHTGDAGYWLPLKPRIKIYAFTDTTYSIPLYTYDAFTDGSGGIDKPIGLQFESVSTSAGTFSLEIDNSADTYDLDLFSRGNRVTIECSKDGLVWASAFRGLVRSAKQKVYGPDNRSIYIEGYSYMIRLNERILSVKKQAALIGNVYNRADSTMFSDNLINDLLTNDADYLKTVDDTQLYSIFKTSNITASPIDDWVPRLDVQLSPVDEAISSVLEFSQSFLTVDVSNDQIVMFNPDRVPSGGANAFLVTDNVSPQGDSSLNTMYPTTDYTYEISYDFADSANRLISAIGNVECPSTVIPGTTTPGSVGGAVYANTVTPPSGSVGTMIYNAWSVDNFVGLGPGLATPAQRFGIYVADVDLIGKTLAQIAFAVRRGTGTGSVRFSIRKAAGDVLIDFGTLDIATVPGDGLYHGYQGTNLTNNYALVSGDHIAIEDVSLTASISVSLTNGSNSDPPHRYNSGTWFADSVLAPYSLSSQIWLNTLDTSNYGTVKLNGGTVQRVAFLLASGSGIVGAKIGRITFGIRTGGTSPNGTFQVGIRRGSDNFFIQYGGGPFNTSTLTPQDDTFRNYSFDALANTYAAVVGDRISIEVIGMTVGYLELEASLDGGSPNTVQVYNGTTWSTTGVTSFRLGASIYVTTASTTPDTNIDPCGGLPETEDADPTLAIASDANMAKRIGMVEQVISNIPAHVKTFQTLIEYLFNKLYVMARPRFTFSYPSLTLPGIMPKAGDICAHVSKKANVGKARTAVQTGVITEVTYDFGQDSDSILGLRRLSIQTNGVLRGSY